MPCYRPLHSALNQVVYGETGQSITTVVVDGRVVLRNGELTHRSSRELKAAAEDVRARMQPAIAEVARRNAELLPPLLDAYRRANACPLPIDRYRMPRPTCACGCSHD